MYSYPALPCAVESDDASRLDPQKGSTASPSEEEEVEITVTPFPPPPPPKQRGRTLASRHSHALIRSTPVKKITGFNPVVPSTKLLSTPCQVGHGVVTSSPSRRLGRLSPAPRRRLSFSSPWILPGKGDVLDWEVGSLEALPHSLEFKKYLMGRIESDKRVSFNRLRAVPSML